MMIAPDDAADARRAVARGDVEEAARGVRPGVMHIGRQRDGAAPRQRRAFDIDLVMRQLRPDAGVKRHPVRDGLGHGIAPSNLRGAIYPCWPGSGYSVTTCKLG